MDGEGRVAARFERVHWDESQVVDRASEVLRAVSGSTLAARLSVNIELAPNDASAHLWYGMYWALLQRREASLPELRFAQQLDPLSIQTSTYVGFALYLLRDYAQVIAQSQESLKIDPQNWGSHANLGEAYHQTGKYIEAITEFEKAKELSDSPALLAELRHADGAAGKNAEARRVLAELKELSKRQYVPAYAIAVAYLGLGIERKL